MDDSMIMYIIILALGLLSQLFKKKKKPEAEDYEDQPGKPTMTFEDLLREFQEKSSPKQKPQRMEREKPRVEEFESNIPDDDEVDEVYQKAISQAEKKEKIPADDFPKFGHFASFDQKNEESELVKEIKSNLQTPENAAKAIIYSEILNKKY